MQNIYSLTSWSLAVNENGETILEGIDSIGKEISSSAIIGYDQIRNMFISRDNSGYILLEPSKEFVELLKTHRATIEEVVENLKIKVSFLTEELKNKQEKPMEKEHKMIKPFVEGDKVFFTGVQNVTDGETGIFLRYLNHSGWCHVGREKTSEIIQMEIDNLNRNPPKEEGAMG